jgi:hypothetical protein
MAVASSAKGHDMGRAGASVKVCRRSFLKRGARACKRLVDLIEIIGARYVQRYCLPIGVVGKQSKRNVAYMMHGVRQGYSVLPVWFVGDNFFPRGQ